MTNNLKKAREKLQEFFVRRKQRELGLFFRGCHQDASKPVTEGWHPYVLKILGGKRALREAVQPTRCFTTCHQVFGAVNPQEEALISFPCLPYPCHLYPSGVHSSVTAPQPHTNLSRDEELATPSREAGSPVLFPQRQSVVKGEKCPRKRD